MKTRVVRIAAATFALGVLLAGPAAASAPPSPVLAGPAPGSTITPDLHPCDVAPWWFWCR